MMMPQQSKSVGQESQNWATAWQTFALGVLTGWFLRRGET